MVCQEAIAPSGEMDCKLEYAVSIDMTKLRSQRSAIIREFITIRTLANASLWSYIDLFSL
jgi:hypothetical protein